MYFPRILARVESFSLLINFDLGMSNVVEFFERRKYIFFRCAGVVARRIPLSRVASSQPARKRLFSLYLSRSRVLAPIATARRRAYCSRMCLSVFRGIELGFVFTLSLHVSCAFETYFCALFIISSQFIALPFRSYYQEYWPHVPTDGV